jgi:hypothetical protein
MFRNLPAALDWFGRSLVFVTGPNGRPDIVFVAWTKDCKGRNERGRHQGGGSDVPAS